VFFPGPKDSFTYWQNDGTFPLKNSANIKKSRFITQGKWRKKPERVDTKKPPAGGFLS
jgi:hypothetical protein